MRTALAFLVCCGLCSTAIAGSKQLPPSAALDAAKRLVLETFRKELSAPDKTPAIRAMLDTAATTDADADKAALYLSAADVAARAGETKLSFEALDGLGATFEIDSLALKEVYLDAAAKSAKSNEVRVSIANRGLELADLAISASRFDIAESALKTSAAASSKVRDAELRKAIASKRRDVEKAKRQHDQIEAAIAGAQKTLKEKPDDPDANETLGKHLAFDRNDWRVGLKHLAKAENSDLQKAALADQSGASEPSQSMTLGDWWWTLGEGAENARDKAGYQSRAVFWYTRAVSSLTGLQKTRIEKRLKDAGDTALAAAASQSGNDNGKFIDITLAPGVVMRLVRIPASKDGKIKEFYLGQTEVTQKQWTTVMGSNPSLSHGDSKPANFVTQDECRQFCERLSGSASWKGLEFRLPSYDEWLHAFLAEQDLDDVLRTFRSSGWNRSNSDNSLHFVKQLAPSAWGLYDMQGNCWEWSSKPEETIGGSYDTPENANGGKLLPGKFSGKAASIGFRIAAEAR